MESTQGRTGVLTMLCNHTTTCEHCADFAARVRNALSAHVTARPVDDGTLELKVTDYSDHTKISSIAKVFNRTDTVWMMLTWLNRAEKQLAEERG